MIRRAQLLLLAALAACASPAHEPARSGWTDISRETRPTLEEIFLQPPVSGEAPDADALSADGRFLLLRWDAKAREGRGRPALRLLDVARPEASGLRGTPLDELVPKFGGAGDEDEIGRVVWSHSGALLAIARGPDILLLDPLADRVAPLLLPAVRERGERGEKDAEAETEDPSAAAQPAERMLAGRIRSVEFSPDDRELRFADAEELYSLPLPARGLPREPASLEDARLLTGDLEPLPSRAQWSRDLGVVFSADPPLAKDEDGEGPDAKEGDSPARQVFHLADGRFVGLEGVEGMKWLEDERLSPDGRFVFGAEYDRETEPPPTIVPDYLTERVTTHEARRLLAEDGPSPFRLWMWDTTSGVRTPVLPEDEAPAALAASAPAPDAPDGQHAPDGDAADDAPAPEPGARRLGPYWLRTIGWAPADAPDAPACFAYELLSADFRDLEIWCWAEGERERVWSEHDDAWIGGPARYARWSPDGLRLVLGSESYAGSTTPGRCQLFAVDVETGDVRQLTEVAGEVARFTVTDDGAVVFQASEEDPARTVLARIPATQVRGEFRPEPEPFPAPAGWNASFVASRDGRRVVFQHEGLLRPAELWTADRSDAARLTRTTPRAFEEIDWIRPERIALTSPDGRTIRAHVFLPPGTSLAPGANAEPRATIVFVHGAGYLQNVTDSMTRYPLNLMFHSRLAHLGYPVVDVDYRGSAGYGRDFRTDVQYHLGGKDLDDIHLVVDELVARGLVDRERVGIYGGSYGGFMTMMALFTAPERWAVGAALRSVTDWRTYHPAYTQPRLGRPSTHPEAYVASSPIDHVADVRDPLLVLHGMEDRNVFAQDSIRLIEALIDQGSDFDAMLYPSQGHAFSDGEHWLDEYRRIERYLLGHLGPPVREPAVAAAEAGL